jgi:hypothetical protein
MLPKKTQTQNHILIKSDIEKLEYQYFIFRGNLEELYKDIFHLEKNARSYIFSYLKILLNNEKKNNKDFDFRLNGSFLIINQNRVINDKNSEERVQINLNDFLKSESKIFNHSLTLSNIKMLNRIKNKVKSYDKDIKTGLMTLCYKSINTIENQKLILNDLIKRI